MLSRVLTELNWSGRMVAWSRGGDRVMMTGSHSTDHRPLPSHLLSRPRSGGRPQNWSYLFSSSWNVQISLHFTTMWKNTDIRCDENSYDLLAQCPVFARYQDQDRKESGGGLCGGADQWGLGWPGTTDQSQAAAPVRAGRSTELRARSYSRGGGDQSWANIKIGEVLCVIIIIIKK